MSWVTESWRLKLLAIGLSVLMLGAVAFAQNPPTFADTVPDRHIQGTKLRPPSRQVTTATQKAQDLKKKMPHHM